MEAPPRCVGSAAPGRSIRQPSTSDQRAIKRDTPRSGRGARDSWRASRRWRRRWSPGRPTPIRAARGAWSSLLLPRSPRERRCPSSWSSRRRGLAVAPRLGMEGSRLRRRRAPVRPPLPQGRRLHRELVALERGPGLARGAGGRARARPLNRPETALPGGMVGRRDLPWTVRVALVPPLRRDEPRGRRRAALGSRSLRPARVPAGPLPDGRQEPALPLASSTREYLSRCGQDVTWELLPGKDHGGEWRAYAAPGRTKTILVWLLAHPAACALDAGAAPPSDAGSVDAAPSATETAPSASSFPAPRAPPSVSPQPATGSRCACSAPGEPATMDAQGWLSLVGLLALGLRVRRGDRQRG